MRWNEHVARMGEMINAYKFVVGKTEGNKSLGIPRLVGKIIIEWISGK